MQKVYRIIDANFNRSREGLRVCEDIMRFIFKDSKLTLKLKNTRRALSRLAAELDRERLIQSRDVEIDRVKFKGAKGSKFKYDEILRFNFQRVTESLRVLEEVIQILEPDFKQRFMRLRFKVYEIEKGVSKVI
jgi:hypothetical protein